MFDFYHIVFVFVLSGHTHVYIYLGQCAIWLKRWFVNLVTVVVIYMGRSGSVNFHKVEMGQSHN